MEADASYVPTQFEIAIRNLARKILFPTQAGLTPEEREARNKGVPEIQLQLRSESRLMQFRELGVSSDSEA